MIYDTGKFNPSGKRKYTFKAPVGFPSAGIPVPCGKCLPCLESRRKEWCKRLYLESTRWPVSSFVTLTFDDVHLPWCHLACKRKVQTFLKRLRMMPRDYNVPSLPFKYFIASEYGKKFGRPHFHGLIFGLDFLDECYRPRLVSCGRYPVFTSDILSAIWKNGYVTVDRLSISNVAYVSKYITKQFDKFHPSWSLKSIGLSRDLFANKNGLTDFGISSVLSGFVALPSKSQPVRVRVPKFVDRYVERFNPDLYASIKACRRDYFRKMPLADLAMCRDVHELKHSRDLKERILDNET